MKQLENYSTNWKKYLSIGSILIFFFLLFTHLYKLQNIFPFPHQGDQAAYLELAINLNQGDGFITRGLSSFKPTKEITHLDGARSPLYPLFLSTVAKPEFDTYWKTRRLNLLFSLFALFVIFQLISKLFSKSISIPVVLLLALNEHFSKFSINLWCENMFTLWGTLCWGIGIIWLINWEKNKKQQWLYPVTFGLFSALSYLTKENGLFFPLCFFLVILGKKISLRLTRKNSKNVITIKEIGIALFIFLLFAIPYWVVNYQDTGSISRTYELKGRFWLDQGIQSYFVHDSIPTFFSYWKSHTVGQMITKMGVGMGKQFFNFIHLFDLSKEWTFGKTIPLGWLIFPLSLFGLFFVLKKEIRIYSIFLFIIWYLLFSWYHHIDTAPRFIFPLIVILLTTSCLAVKEIHLLIQQKISKPFPPWLKWSIPGIFLCLFLKGILLIMPGLPSEPQPMEQDRAKLLNFYLTKTDPNAIIAYGPSHGYSLRWVTGRREIFIPLFETLDEFLNYLDEYSADYLMLDMEIVHRRSWLFESVVKNYPKMGLVQEALIPGWKPVLVSKNKPKMYYLFKRDEEYGKLKKNLQ